MKTAPPSTPAAKTPEAAKNPAPDANDLEEIKVSCLYIDRCFDRLKSESEADLIGDRAASIILSAERTLPVFWGVDPKTLDAATRAKIDAYPTEIRVWVDRINELKSRQTLAEIQKIDRERASWFQANGGADVPYQAWIDRDQADTAGMQKLMLGMSAGPSLDEASRLLIAVQKQLNDHTRAQYTRYQKRALERCHRVANYVLTNTVWSIEKLTNEFNESEIAKIDAGLLGADARRMYDTAIGMMESKLKDRDRANFLLNLTGTEKWPLSDF